MATAELSEDTSFILTRHFAEVDEFYMARSFRTILGLLAAYLLFVLKLGPAFMKNREPYKMKTAILVYNAAQVLISFWIVFTTAKMSLNFFPKRCFEEDPKIRKEMLVAMHIYIFCKLSELIDTIFFVLRKKYNQVSFLHVYHHTTVVLGSWVMFMYSPNQTCIFSGFVNGIVHVIMYSYYFMAALGPQYQKYLTWKKFITNIQLIQFIAVILHQILVLFFTKCQHTIFGIGYVIYSCIVFYILFNNFYKQSYKKPKKGDRENENNGTISEKMQ